MPDLGVIPEPRQSDVAYVLAKLRIRGVDHLLLHAHHKWGDWSLVGGHVEPTDLDFQAAATREVQEEMAPLRCGSDLEVDSLELPMAEWGPVPSRSAGGVPTRYRARWYLLKFKTDPTTLLQKLPADEFRLLPVSECLRFPSLSSAITRASELLGEWQNLPLSWERDLETPPLHVLDAASQG